MGSRRALLADVAREAGDRTLSLHPRHLQRGWLWPPEPSLRRRALFALALTHDLAGRRDSAIVIYRRLRAEHAQASPSGSTPDANASARMLPWLELFLAEPYTGHPDQYVKGQVPSPD